MRIIYNMIYMYSTYYYFMGICVYKKKLNFLRWFLFVLVSLYGELGIMQKGDVLKRKLRWSQARKEHVLSMEMAFRSSTNINALPPRCNL